jgi:hypothetical protein
LANRGFESRRPEGPDFQGLTEIAHALDNKTDH